MTRLKKSEIAIAPALVQKGYSRVSVPIDPIESLYHWVLRVVSAKHLMDRGYGHNHIFLERTFIKGSKRARADVYASKNGEELWIECKPIWGLPVDALQIRVR